MKNIFRPHFDEQTKANITTIDLHHAIHHGLVWETFYYEAAVAAGAARNILIMPGSTNNLHCIFTAYGSGEYEVRLFKGTATSANGTVLTPYNLNDNYDSNSRDFSVYHTPTITGDGTQRHCSGGSGNIDSLTLERNFTSAGTKYLFRVTNSDPGSKTLIMNVIIVQVDKIKGYL